MVGIAMGFGFFLHALIPHSNAWPMLWPAAAGALSVVLVMRSGQRPAFWESIGIGVKAGTVAGAIFFVATALALWLLSNPALAPLSNQLGAQGPINLSLAVLPALGFAAALGVVLAGLAAGAAYPVSRRRV
jgi:hypothetical protein